MTGIGLVSSLGIGREASLARLFRGERGIAQVSLFDTTGLRSRLAAEVGGLDVRAIAPREEADDWSRSDAMAFIAAREALEQARHLEGAPLAVALGGTTGGMYETERSLKALAARGIHPHDARRLLDFPLAVSVDRVSRALGSLGPSATVCSACSSGAVALVLGASWLLSGRATRVLAGGVDGLCELTFSGFNAIGAVDPHPCRPFDVSRAGLTLGEGAGCLVLELESSARARDARIIAFLSGWALASEAHHITHPEPSGQRATAALRAAMACAGLSPSEVDYVNAHGTGTIQNDAMEARALGAAFGDQLGRVWVSSAKAQIGHTLGAAGALEAAFTALSLEQGLLLPMVGLETPELPELRLVRAPGQRAQLGAALSSSFGFGGACAVLAFEAPDSQARPLPRPVRSRIVISGAASYGPSGVASGPSSLRLLEPGFAPDLSPPDPLSLLDPDRSRRFGRSSALVVATAERALGEADCGPEGVGFVVGSAFGDVERSVKFLQKVLSVGPRSASPAEFPQLIASTGSGNASIYLSLTGPCLSVSEFATSSECAVSVAIALLELELARAVVSGAAEAADPIVDAVLGAGAPVARAEGGGFVVLEPLVQSLERGHTPLAEIILHRALRGDPSPAFAALPPPSKGARVIAGRLPASVAGALARSAWAAVASCNLPAQIGFHEAIGGTALALGAALLGAGEAELVLSINAELDLTYVTLLRRCGTEA